MLQNLPELTQSPELTLPELPLAPVQTLSCLHEEVSGWSAKQVSHALLAAGSRLAAVHTTCFLLVESRKKKRRKKKKRKKKKTKSTSMTCHMLTQCNRHSDPLMLCNRQECIVADTYNLFWH